MDGNNITIKEEADKIKQEIKQGQSFGDIAREYVVALNGSKGKSFLPKIGQNLLKKALHCAVLHKYRTCLSK